MVSLMCSTPVFSRSGDSSHDYVWDSISSYTSAFSLSYENLTFSELLIIKNMCDSAGVPFTSSLIRIFVEF